MVFRLGAVDKCRKSSAVEPEVDIKVDIIKVDIKWTYAKKE